MNHQIDEGFPVSNSVSDFWLTTKKVNPFVRGLNKVNHLPVIKEEDSIFEGESEIVSESIEEDDNDDDDDNDDEISTKSLNINCLMNVDVKQSRCIWDTNFGKRLLKSRDVYEVLNAPDEIIAKIHSFETIITTEFKNHKKNNGKDKKQCNQAGNSRKKVKPVRKKSLEIIKEKSNIEETTLETIADSTESTPTMLETLSFSKTSASTLNSKPTSLTKCIKKIFEENRPPLNCQYCNEILSDIEELCNHQNQHEFDKQSCLLCEKIFYNPSKFARHLLTHEGVDRFSCKKCMTYFPSLIKLKKHIQDFHYKPPPIVSYIRPPKLDTVNKYSTKFECKRCKMELDSAKMYEIHKRNHLKKDLAKTYFLIYNNV